MNTMEIFSAAFSLASMIFSVAVLFVAYNNMRSVHRTINYIKDQYDAWKDTVNDVDTALFNTKEDLLDLKNRFYASGIETLKVRSEDHDQAIESIRKDMLDLQVISGTLPSRAGTMLEEVNNTLEEQKKLQSAFLEQQAILEKTKDQVSKLAEAYAELHFTGKEIEEMRDRLEDLKRRVA